MSFTELKTQKEYYKLLPQDLTKEEQRILYINIYNIKKELEKQNKRLPAIIYRMKQASKKIKPKRVICPCCNHEMCNTYFYLHKKTKLYAKNMEDKQKIDKNT